MVPSRVARRVSHVGRAHRCLRCCASARSSPHSCTWSATPTESQSAHPSTEHRRMHAILCSAVNAEPRLADAPPRSSARLPSHPVPPARIPSPAWRVQSCAAQLHSAVGLPRREARPWRGLRGPGACCPRHRPRPRPRPRPRHRLAIASPRRAIAIAIAIASPSPVSPRLSSLPPCTHVCVPACARASSAACAVQRHSSGAPIDQQVMKVPMLVESAKVLPQELCVLQCAPSPSIPYPVVPAIPPRMHTHAHKNTNARQHLFRRCAVGPKAAVSWFVLARLAAHPITRARARAPTHAPM